MGCSVQQRIEKFNEDVTNLHHSIKSNPKDPKAYEKFIDLRNQIEKINTIIFSQQNIDKLTEAKKKYEEIKSNFDSRLTKCIAKIIQATKISFYFLHSKLGTFNLVTISIFIGILALKGPFEACLTSVALISGRILYYSKPFQQILPKSFQTSVEPYQVTFLKKILMSVYEATKDFFSTGRKNDSEPSTSSSQDINLQKSNNEKNDKTNKGKEIPDNTAKIIESEKEKQYSTNPSTKKDSSVFSLKKKLPPLTPKKNLKTPNNGSPDKKE